MHRSQLLLSCSLSVALAQAVLGSAAAQATPAQATPAKDAKGGDEYIRVVEEALQEFNLGNWDEAAVLFERAHIINPSARTERGMGMAAFEARHYVVAISHLSAALNDTRNPLTAGQRDEVQRALDRSHDYVARVYVNAQPSDARVRINGHLVEPDVRGDRLADPGLQELEIAADGYESVLRRVHVVSGKRETLAVTLRKAASNLPAAPTIAVSSGAPDTNTDNEADNSALHTWKWVLGGTGLAGLAAGAAFLVAQKTEAGRFNNECDPENLQGDCVGLEQRAGSTWYIGSIVGLGLGAGLVSASALLFMLDGAERKPDHARGGECQIGFADVGVRCRVSF
jgi:hypothetical protein